MRYISIIILLLLLSLCNYAQRNWVGVSPSVFTTWQFDDSHLTTLKTGAGAGVELMYQYQKKHFILEAGLEGTYNYHHVGVGDSLLSFSMIDTQGTPFQYKGLLSNREDQSHNLAVRIPLMLGVEFDYVYLLAGAKLHFNILGRSKSYADLTTSGEYDMFYEEIVNVPSHGFSSNQPMATKGNITYSIDLRPSIEFGVVFNNKYRRNKMHLGLYAEYGLLNSLPRFNSEELIIPDLSQYMQVSMSHIYNTTHVSKLNHLAVGIRFKAFLQLQSNNKNKCRCL